MTRRNIWISDELWNRICREASKQGAKEGKPLSCSEWIRRAIEKALR
jgi:hypothetical protein